MTRASFLGASNFNSEVRSQNKRSETLIQNYGKNFKSFFGNTPRYYRFQNKT